MSSFEKWSHWMDIAIFRTVDVGVTRAYDVLKKQKYSRGRIPQLRLWIRTKKVTNVAGLSGPKIAVKSNVGSKIC